MSPALAGNYTYSNKRSKNRIKVIAVKTGKKNLKVLVSVIILKNNINISSESPAM